MELLLLVAELKILAAEKAVTVIEVKDDKLMLTRHADFITLGGKFPRLTKKESAGAVEGNQAAVAGHLKFGVALRGVDGHFPFGMSESGTDNALVPNSLKSRRRFGRPISRPCC